MNYLMCFFRIFPYCWNSLLAKAEHMPTWSRSEALDSSSFTYQSGDSEVMHWPLCSPVFLWNGGVHLPRCSLRWLCFNRFSVWRHVWLGANDPHKTEGSQSCLLDCHPPTSEQLRGHNIWGRNHAAEKGSPMEVHDWDLTSLLIFWASEWWRLKENRQSNVV